MVLLLPVLPPLLIFDLGIFELLLIAVLAVMLFGGDLPDAMRRAGRAVRKLRDLADELARQVDPPADLHPRNLLPPDVRHDLTRDLPRNLVQDLTAEVTKGLPADLAQLPGIDEPALPAPKPPPASTDAPPAAEGGAAAPAPPRPEGATPAEDGTRDPPA